MPRASQRPPRFRAPGGTDLIAPTFRSSQAFSEGNVLGARTYALATMPALGSACLLLVSSRFGAINSVDGFGTVGWPAVYSREGSSNPFPGAFIAFLPAVTSQAAQSVTVNLNGSFSTQDIWTTFLELSNFNGAGKTIKQSFTEFAMTNYSAAQTSTVAAGPVSPGQLVATLLTHSNEPILDPTFTHSPEKAGRWVNGGDRHSAQTQGLQTWDMVIAGPAAASYSSTRDYLTSSGTNTIRAAVVIG